MTDTRKKSLSEAFVNSFGSYPIGYGIGILILPVSTGWLQEDPFVANIFITLSFATVSFIRVYFLRRLFVRLGFDDNFLKLGIKLYQKVKIKFSRLGCNKMNIRKKTLMKNSSSIRDHESSSS